VGSEFCSLYHLGAENLANRVHLELWVASPVVKALSECGVGIKVCGTWVDKPFRKVFREVSIDVCIMTRIEVLKGGSTRVRLTI